MAREVHEREDLLRDARALTPRVQIQLPPGDREEIVFAGFRGESLSLFFGDDPVYHFNGRRELRRAFVDDRLIKAEQRRLVALTRVRSEEAVALQRHALEPHSQEGLLTDLRCRLDALRNQLAAGQYRVDGEAPIGGNGLQLLTNWLAQGGEIAVAVAPGLA